MIRDRTKYQDCKRQRTLDLRPDGIDCIPVLGMSNFQEVHRGTEEHIHAGCIEICLCLRGRMFFESQNVEYPFLPGMVFVSQPNEPHRMRRYPKGLWLERILFKIPVKTTRILGLDEAESRWLVRQLRHFPMRLFPATDRVKRAFDQAFTVYDSEKCGTTARQLKMKAAILELLLALVEAPQAEPTPRGKPNARVNAIIDRMRANPERDYPLEDLAREAALSTVAFNDAFKRKTGLPPHAFLLEERVRAAGRDLARDTGITVSRVAHKYRFSSAQHFATVFKRITGYSPGCRLAPMRCS